MNLNVTSITNVLVCKKTHRKLMTTVQLGGGGWLLPIHSLKWNPNHVFTTWQQICVLIMRITSKPKDQWFWEGTKHAVRRRDCFAVFYLGNLLILCRFLDIVCGFLFLLNNFPLQSLEIKYATYSNYNCV